MYQTSKFVGAVRYNVPKCCAALLCRALRRVARMCSSTLSDPANRLLKRTDSEGSSSVAEKKSSAVPLFRCGHMSAICARLTNKGKVGVQRGRETAGVPSFLSPPRMRQSPALRRAHFPAEVQRKTLRPLGRTACAVQIPRSAGAEKGAARKRTNTLTQFAYPSHSVPRMRDRSAVLGKSKNPIPNGTGFCTSLYMCSGISPER